MKSSGIYCIRNKINNKRYVGQSSNLNKRKKSHFRRLNNNYHFNSYLQNSFNKYGDSNFVFEILILCEQFELNKYEQYFINKFGDYNIATECVGTTLGVKYTKKVKEKLSKINSGENNPMYGRKHTEKTKKIMSEKAKGKNNSMYNRKYTEKELKNLSEKFSGENNPNSRLTWEDIKWIRENKNNYTGLKIAEMFGISKSQVYNIINNKAWKETNTHSFGLVEGRNI